MIHYYNDGSKKIRVAFQREAARHHRGQEGGQTNPSGIHTQVGLVPYFFSRKEEGSMPSLLAIFSM